MGLGKLRFIRVSKQPIGIEDSIEEVDKTNTKSNDKDQMDVSVYNGIDDSSLVPHPTVLGATRSDNHNIDQIDDSNISHQIHEHSNSMRVKNAENIIDLVASEEKNNQSSEGEEVEKGIESLSIGVDIDAVVAVDKSIIVEPDLKVCPHCQKNIRLHNFLLHEVHCGSHKKSAKGGEQRGSQSENSSAGGNGSACVNRQSNSSQSGYSSIAGARKKDAQQQQLKLKSSKSQGNTGTKNASQVRIAADVLKKVDPDDFDAMLDSIKKLDSKCAFKKCKVLTNTLGRNCEYCSLRFCLTHLMPEIHGCGDAVKEAARRIISRDGVLHSGSGHPSHKPNAQRRGLLERKMEKKMEELSGKRSRKKKDNKE